jgi:hypothetical protein
MTAKDIRKIISAHFEGRALERLRWTLEQVGHSWIELAKEPALRLGLGEVWADRTKYVLGLAPVGLGLLALEWAATGSFL